MKFLQAPESRGKMLYILFSSLGMLIMAPGNNMQALPKEVIGNTNPGPEEQDAYERVLTDAMAGDATLFARKDYVEEAWRIVDEYLAMDTPVYDYEPGTWGPADADKKLKPPGGWNNPEILKNA